MSEAQPPTDSKPVDPTAVEQDWESLARGAANHAAAVTTNLEDVVQLLSFELAGAPYAVPVERVREIVRMRAITPIPRVPDAVRGVISLRGEIIEVVDLRRQLELEPTEATRRTRIIVVGGEQDRTAAILVDAVHEVLRVTDQAIQPAGASESGAIEALCSDGDRFVSMIDLDRVLAIHA